MIEATETLVLKESFEYCPYIRAMQKEQRRNAEIRDGDKRLNMVTDDEDIPEATRLKAHLKRRVERQTKNKWVQYATEYASEIVMSGDTRKAEMRNYLDMVKDAVMTMDQKDKEKRDFERDRRLRTRQKHAF